jgi:pimeloyl-ACP methyl ester carboxylesterase
MSFNRQRALAASGDGAPKIGHLSQLLLSLLVVAVPLAPAAQAEPMLTGDGGTPAFYTWNGGQLGAPGTLLRQERGLADLANAERSVRILYVSTDGIGGKAKVPVSGVLYLPKGEAPEGGWPLIAWAHGTVGVADVCAPSFAGRSPRDVTYLDFWLAQGYAVVASDYQGLGVPGPHPYLATRPEAYSILDSVRAVQRGGFGVAKKVVLIGQSQGGGAVFATAAYAPAYAPELDIRGTVATGTPYFSSETRAAWRAARSPDAVDRTLGFSFLLLSLVEQIDPGFSVRDYVTDAALPVVIAAGKSCYGEIARQIVAAQLTHDRAFKYPGAPVFAKVFPLVGYPTLAIKTPVFLGTGGKDHEVPPEVQLHLGADACGQGSTIEQHVYPDLDHSGTVSGSTADSAVFVRKAFAGDRIAGNCGARPNL